MRAFLATVAVAFIAVPSAMAYHATIFRDDVGDASESPDLEHLWLSNENDGTFQFSLRIANRTEFVPGDEYRIHLDTDQNFQTGSPVGSEWVIFIYVDLTGEHVNLNRWEGGQFEIVPGVLPVDGPFWSTGPNVVYEFADLELDYGSSFDLFLITHHFNALFSDAMPDEDEPLSFTLTRAPTCDLNGTTGDEELVGSFEPDWICGFEGEDTIRGLEGRDRLNGGPDEDLVNGGTGADRIKGGPGNDALRGKAGADRIKGGGGEDRIKAGRGADTIFARDGEVDRVRCGRGDDRVASADDDDVLRGC